MTLLQEGTTCWRKVNAQRVSLLVDVDDYFRALRQAALAAQERIFIIGWDVDSRTRLVPEDVPEDGFPPTLLDFLNELLASKPDLHVYVLSWDFSMIYSFEREPLQSYKFGWRAHERLHFSLDGKHPVWASHHQKLVVIDDRVAFNGGMDLTIRRWDTCEHLAEDPRRVDPRGEPYAPMHDLQLAVDGDAARALGELARGRWFDATGERLSAPGASVDVRAESDPWPPLAAVDFRDVELAIVRTAPAFEARTEPVREVLRFNLAAIAAARERILIENQYLTAAQVGDALAERLGQAEGPEIVVLLPKTECGWMEQSSLGILRTSMLERLRAADIHHRLHVYYPEVPCREGQSLNVHSKALIVDDWLLKIGSSNLTNRSMGIDTECDLVLEADPDDPRDAALREAIAGIGYRLLGEHLNDQPARIAQEVAECGSLAKVIDSRRGSLRCLLPLEPDPTQPPLNFALLDGMLVDPERPMAAEGFLDQMVPHELRRPTRKSLLVVAGVVGALLSTVLWRVLPGPIGYELAALAAWARELTASPAAPFYVAMVYVLATAAFVPVTLLIAATALLFPPWLACAFGLFGSLCAALTTYAAGRVLGPQVLWRFRGNRMRKLRTQLSGRGFRAVAAARLLPLGHFTVVNLLAGGMRVPVTKFVLANVVGLLPGIVVLSFFADRLWQLVRAPNLVDLAYVVTIAAGLIYLLRWLQRALQRVPAARRQQLSHAGPSGGGE